MATGKLSATVEAELLAELRHTVGPRGVSAFVNRALRHELDRVALRVFLDRVAEEVGPPDEALVSAVGARLDAAVAGRATTKKRRGSAA